jgi:signal transduction histidine kinase
MKSPPPGPGSARVAAVAAGAAVIVALAGAVTAAAFDPAGSAVFAETLSFGIAVSAVAVTGAVITLAVPGNRVGWLLLAAAAVMGVGSACTEAGVYGVVTDPGSVPGAPYLAGLGPGLQAAGMLMAVTGVPAIFPDGRLPGPRWLGWTVIAAVILLFLGNVLSPHAQQSRLAHWRNPFGLTGAYAGVANALSAPAILLAVAAATGAVTGLVIRWRRGGPLIRQQLLFLAVAAVPPVVLFGVVLLPLPAAIAVATLAHGLYDLRRAAHRTLLWLAMSGVVAGVYAAVVIAAAALVPAQRAWWPSALAAAAAALALIPLREKLQRGVTRVVYGRWHEPYEVLAGLGERLEAAADIDRLLSAALTELTTGLDLRNVTVSGPGGDLVASATPAAGPAPAGPAPAGPAAVAAIAADVASIPLQAYGLTVGSLSYHPPGRPLSTSEQRLVRDLARQLGGALHARLLREDLQRARERLVLAREEERRRLRRDLHDGIGPVLAGLTLKAETARALLPPGADGASRQLHDLGEEIRRTVVDVRRLVEGLRPPALDELGLAGACQQAVERLTAQAGLDVDVHVPGDLPVLPAAVEVAAYRIVVEAVTNAVRHAGARHCHISLACTPAGLAVTVSDDGSGLRPAGHHGHGLAIMRERAEELGGTVTVTDTAPGGAVPDGPAPGGAVPGGPAPGVTVQALLPAAAAALPVPA